MFHLIQIIPPKQHCSLVGLVSQVTAVVFPSEWLVHPRSFEAVSPYSCKHIQAKGEEEDHSWATETEKS